MAANRPVIATAAGGPLETVINGETGWLVPPNNPQALANKIGYLISNPELAHEMGSKGKKRAFNEFSLERLIKEMELLFEKIVTKKLT